MIQPRLQPRFKGQTDIHEWSHIFRVKSMNCFYNFVVKEPLKRDIPIKDHFNLRDDIDSMDLFERILFPMFFSNKRDMETFIALINLKKPVLRKELCVETGMKRTNQYKALKRLMDRNIVGNRTEKNGGRGRPKSYFFLVDGIKDIMRESVLRYSKGYMCECQGMKARLMCKDGVTRVICVNRLCHEDEEYIDKKSSETCEHGLQYYLCDICRMKFMLR